MPIKPITSQLSNCPFRKADKQYKRGDVAAFKEAMVGAGYTEHSFVEHSGSRGYLGSLQKRVMDGPDTLFFLNMNLWDMKVATYGALKERLFADTAVQFNDQNDIAGDRIDVRRPLTSVTEIEAFYMKMWKAMEFGRYEAV
jgi:hypothetical protein